MKKKKNKQHKQKSPKNFAPLLDKIVILGWVRHFYIKWKTVPLWTVVFWAWVVWVSLWIDQAPAKQIDEIRTPQKLLDIEFTAMRFEQKYTDGMQLVVESPRAWIDEEKQKLYLENPVLTQIIGENDTYFASGDFGEVDLKLQQSALPSSFDQLTITGNAQAKSGATSVKTEEMIFDCSTQKFYCPGRFEFDQGGLKINSENKMYDPREKRMSNPN